MHEYTYYKLILYNDIVFPFGIDSDGNYGYFKAGADTVTPFSSSAFEEVLSVTAFYGTSPTAFYAASDFSYYSTQYQGWSRGSYISLGDYFEGTMPSSGYAATIRTKVACKVTYMLRLPNGSNAPFYYYPAQSYSAHQTIATVSNTSWSGVTYAGAQSGMFFAIKE